MENSLVSEAPRRSKASRLLTFGAGAAAGFVAVGVVYYVSTSQDDTSTVAIADTVYFTPEGWQGKPFIDFHDAYDPERYDDEEDADLSLEAEDDADEDVSVFAEEDTAKRMRARRSARKGMKKAAMKKAMRAMKATKKRSMKKAKKADDEEEDEEDADLSLEAEEDDLIRPLHHDDDAEDDADEDVSAFAQDATAMRRMRAMKKAAAPAKKRSMKRRSMKKKR